MIDSRSIKTIGSTGVDIRYKIPNKYSKIDYFIWMRYYFVLGYSGKNKNHVVVFNYRMGIRDQFKTKSYITCVCNRNILQFNNFDYNLKTRRKYKYTNINLAYPHILSKKSNKSDKNPKGNISKNLSNQDYLINKSKNNPGKFI